MKKITYPLLLVFSALTCEAQFGSGEGEAVGIKKEFNPVPSPPNVAAFEKYGNLPVNYNSGIPQISIPIHEIALSGFAWPIQLSYHASGFKSEDVASRNGLGWNLSAAGVISANQTALSGGAPIEITRVLNLNYANYGLGECLPDNEEDVALAEGLIGGTYSTELVTYNLNTAIINGKFFLKDGGQMMPASDLKIVPVAFSGTMSKCRVYDESGNMYEFMVDGSNTRSSYCQGITSGGPNVSIYLTKIVTAKREEIVFTYDTESYSYRLPDLHVRKIIDPNQVQRCNLELVPEDYYCENTMNAVEKRLRKIEGVNGTVIHFSYSSRNDLPGATKLEQVDIWYKANGDSTLRKRVNFLYGYFGQGTDPYGLQLKLNEVVIKGNNGDSLSSYKFSYNSQALPNKLSAAISFQSGSLSYAWYNISKAGMLEKIQYPTGGFTTFDYEVLPGYGVLRVKEIKDHTDENVVAGLRTFSYNDNPPANIQAVFTESETSFYFGNPINGIAPNCFDDLPCSSPFYWLLSCNRTIWKNSPVRNIIQDYIDQTPRYDSVTEKFGANGENGMIEYVYSSPTILREVPDVFYLSFWSDYLVRKRIYKKNSNGSYSLVKLIRNEYETTACNASFFAQSTHPKEARAWTKKVFMLRPQLILDCCDLVTTYCFPQQFLQQDVRVASVPVYLKKTIEEDYSDADKLTIEKNYYYDQPIHLKPTRIEAYDSRGQLYRTESKYVFDFGGTAVYDTMIAWNKINPVIEHIGWNLTSSQEISRTKTNYQLWQGNTLAEPVTVQNSVLGNTLETEITINSKNSKGKVLQYTTKDGIITSFIWDYMEQYPVAEVTNAPLSNVAYTSFEADGKGGWDFSGAAISDPTVPTGRKCYYLPNGSITRSGLTGSTTSIISYWSKSGSSYSITGSGAPKQGLTVDGWTYFEHEITGVTSTTISGSGYIDELRFYSKGAQMITYTYDPLIGITNKCDANNRTSYYTYDDFGRLQIVRDQDKNIMKKYEYQYYQ